MLMETEVVVIAGQQTNSNIACTAVILLIVENRYLFNFV